MRLASIVLILVSLMVLGLSGCRREADDISQPNYPTHLRHRVELLKDQDGKGGRVRYILYNEEMTKKIGVENQYPDGVTEFEYYREDGTLREINGFYPLDPDGKDTTRKPRRTVLFDKNGKTVLFERITRIDGTAEMYNRSRADGGFETELFYPDGKTTKNRKVTSSSGEVTLEETYRQNGRLETQMRKISYYEYETTEFRENGTRLSVTTRGSSRWSPVYKTVFAADGIQVEMKAQYTSWSVEVEYRRPDGTLAEKRNYSSYGSMTVTTYGPDGKAQWRQEWRGTPVSGDWTDTTNYRITRIEEVKPDGYTATREIELYDDGKTVKKIRIRDGVNYYSGTNKYFRPDGTLEKEEVQEDYNKVKDTKEFKPEENIRETLPDEYLKLTPRQRPKLLTQMPEEMPYEYQQYGEGYPFGEPDPFNPGMPPFHKANYPGWDD